MSVTHIVAVGNKNAIGVNNKLPWHLPEDLKHFKETTTGKIVVVGTNTFKSIVSYSKDPFSVLPGRTLLVVSSSEDTLASLYQEHKFLSNVSFVLGSKLDRMINEVYKDSEFIIAGGAQLYSSVPPDKVILTQINIDVPEADAFYTQSLVGFTRESHSSHESKSGLTYLISIYTKV